VGRTRKWDDPRQAACHNELRPHQGRHKARRTTNLRGLGLHPDGLVVSHLFIELGLNGIEQGTIDNGGLFALEDFPLEGGAPAPASFGLAGSFSPGDAVALP
jgi:hypothetical protein